MAKGPTLEELETVLAPESAKDTILSVLEEAKSDGEGGDVPEAAAAGSESQRQRDEKGRFAPKAADNDGPERDTKAEVIAEKTAAEPADAGSGDGEPEPIDPPYEWSAAEQDEFRSLPRKAQEIVLARYNSATTVAKEASTLKDRYSAIDAIIAPRREGLYRDGMDEATYIRQLTTLSDFAGRDPAGFVRWYSQQRGLTPEQIFQQQAQQPGNMQGMDPELRRMMDANRQLEQKLAGIEQGLTAQQRAQQEQLAQAASNQITEFGSAKDDKGRPVHPYFNEVRAQMGALIGSGIVPDLEQAYKLACQAHPEVSAKIASGERARAERESAQKAREKAAAAKKAGSSVSGTPGDRGKPVLTGDLREDLMATARERGLL